MSMTELLEMMKNEKDNFLSFINTFNVNIQDRLNIEQVFEKIKSVNLEGKYDSIIEDLLSLQQKKKQRNFEIEK